MSLNLTHPSILEDQRLEYRIYLTSDLLPYMEELTVPGPIREETHVQVGRGATGDEGEGAGGDRKSTRLNSSH